MKRLWCALVVSAALFGVRASGQIGTVIPDPQAQFLDANGNPIASGKLCTYTAGTSTPLATYSDSTLVTPNANPVLLNASGRATIYLSAATYKFTLLTAGSDSTCNTGTTVYTQDNIAALAPYNLNKITGAITFSPNTVLTLSSNAITPTLNVHGVDTSGGAQNLNTINTSGVTAPFLLTLYGNNGGANPVTLADGAGNLSLGGGNYTLSTTKTWITLMLKGTTWFELARSTTATVTLPNRFVDGRATLTSGSCFTTADVTAATTVYFTPCGGNTIALFDGSATWTNYTFSELSIAVPATTNTIYDLFVYNNAGTPALETATWTNDTTRATVLVLQNGIYVKSGATTRRYVSSFRTTAVAGQTEDSLLNRYNWNYYNRVDRALQRLESTVSWAYNVNTIRQANASASNQVNFLVGVSEDPVVCDLAVTVVQVTATNNSAVGIGLDSTTTFASNQSVTVANLVANGAAILKANYSGFPGVGKHSLMWNEDAFTNATTTFYGTTATVNAITIAASTSSGLLGRIKG